MKYVCDLFIRERTLSLKGIHVSSEIDAILEKANKYADVLKQYTIFFYYMYKNICLYGLWAD